MSRKCGVRFCALAFCLTASGLWFCSYFVTSRAASQVGAGTEETPRTNSGSLAPREVLERRLSTEVKPFLGRFCFECHGPKKQKGSLDLSRDLTVSGMADNCRQWEMVLERLESREMPPEAAPRQPEAKERAAVIASIRGIRDQEAERNAG